MSKANAKQPSFLCLGLEFWILFLGICCSIVTVPEFCVGQEATKEKPKYEWKTVSGKVVDEDDRPVKDAYVCHSNLNQHPVNHTSTNEKGEFELKFRRSVKALDMGWIWAYSPNHNLRCVTNMRTDNHLLVLPKYTEFKIRFLQPDGEALEQAKILPFRYDVPNGVYAADEDTRLGGIIPNVLAEKIGSSTDENGECLITNIPRALWGPVVVESEEHGRHIIGGGATRDSYQIAKTGSLKIEILPDEPVEFFGTEVHVHGWGRSGENSLKGKIGGLGICKFEHVIPGELEIRLEIDKDEIYQPQIEKNYTVTAGDETHIKIPIKKTVEIRGKVLADGKPVPFARVFVGELETLTSTDELGEFRTRVFPQVVPIRVYRMPREFLEDFETGGKNYISVEDSDGPVTIRPIEIPARHPIPVKVIDEDGDAVTSFRVCSRYKGVRYGPIYTGELDKNGATVAKIARRDLGKFSEASFFLLPAKQNRSEASDMENKNDKPKEIELTVVSSKPFVLRCKRSDLDVKKK